MKLNKLILSTCTLLTFSFAAHAEKAEFTPEDLVLATTTAIDVFKASNEAHFSHLTGFKTWKSGIDAKVKIYMAHDGMNMEYNYLCMKSDSSVHCSAQ